MNMFKKNGGFTLVELIVVIAILAILAGVAVPAYTGYIAKAQEANDMTLLDSVKTAVIFDVMDQEPTAKVTGILVTITDGKGVATFTAELPTGSTATKPTTLSSDFSTLLGQDIVFKSSNTYAKWTAATAKWELSTTALSLS